jgi:hypothetical protein
MMRIVLGLAALAACSQQGMPSRMDEPGSGVGLAPISATPYNDPLVALASFPPLCGATGWCWTNPAPMGNQWDQAYAAGNDLWVTGNGGAGIPNWVLHWDGTTWTEADQPVVEADYANTGPLGDRCLVSAGDTSDLWFECDTGLVYEQVGTSFTLRVALPVQAVEYGTDWLGPIWLAPDTDDVWVVAADELWHGNRSNPGTFTQVASPGGEPTNIYGDAHDDFVVHTDSGLFHYDGSAFATLTAPTLAWVDGFGMNDLWGASDTSLVHYDGNTWNVVNDMGTQSFRMGAGGTTSDVTFLSQPMNGQNMSTWHWDGTELTNTVQPAVVGGGVGALQAYRGTQLLPGNDGVMWEQPPGSQLLVPMLPGNPGMYNSIWPDSDGSFWIAGVFSIFHVIDDVPVAQPLGEAYNINSISGIHDAGGVQVLATGELGRAYTFDGSTWTTTVLPGTNPTNQALMASWMNGALLLARDTGIVVGDDGFAFFWNQGQFTPIATNTTVNLQAAWSPDGNTVYVVGDSGTILQWSLAQPTTMTALTSPTPNGLISIAGAGGTIWLGGTGELWQGNFTTGFTNVAPQDDIFKSLFAVSATDVYVGGDVAVYHSTGGAFLDEQLPATNGTTGYAVAVSPATNERLAAASNALLRHP